MIGGWMWAAQWMKEMERRRKENAEQREAFKRRLRERYGHRELRRIQLTAEEKQELRTKITKQIYGSETVSERR